jgi:predicted Zn-dependent protease
MPRAKPLLLEYLEDRCVPVTYGLPWRNPGHITLSFAPNGTPIAGHQSNLFQTLNAYQPTADWQREILQAFQTWADHAHITIVLHSDDGELFGAPGDVQGDPRFGDIRIGAQTMATDALAVTVPYDPFLSGTWSGDVLLNNTVHLDAAHLLPIALHEAGHTLGLDDNSDPNSVMYSHYNAQHTALSAGDIAAIQALYGPPPPDQGGHDLRTAIPIHVPAHFNGQTPLAVFGQLVSAGDVDYYSVRVTGNYRGPVTIRLQTAGVSLLEPRLTLYDSHGRVLGQTASTVLGGSVLSLTLPNRSPNEELYARVEAATTDAFDIGRFGLAVSLDGRSNVPPSVIDALFRSDITNLSDMDIQAFFHNPRRPFFNKNHSRGHNSFETANTLASEVRGSTDLYYEELGSLSNPPDMNFYRVKAPRVRQGDPNVLTVTLWEVEPNGVLPQVSVYDVNQNPVPGQVLVNENGTFTLQVPQVQSEGWYYLDVAASPYATKREGNYELLVDFGRVQANLPSRVSGSLTGEQTDEHPLYIARSQLMHLVLSAQTTDGAESDAAVRLTIYRNGVPVQTLLAHAGETVSASIFLTPGPYTLRFSTQPPSEGDRLPLFFQLRAAALTDPIGPALDDPTLDPMYEIPGEPGLYNYPGGIISADPFLFIA